MATSLVVGFCGAESVGREGLSPRGGLVVSGEVSKGGQLEENDGVCVCVCEGGREKTRAE